MALNASHPWDERPSCFADTQSLLTTASSGATRSVTWILADIGAVVCSAPFNVSSRTIHGSLCVPSMGRLSPTAPDSFDASSMFAPHSGAYAIVCIRTILGSLCVASLLQLSRFAFSTLVRVLRQTYFHTIFIFAHSIYVITALAHRMFFLFDANTPCLLRCAPQSECQHPLATLATLVLSFLFFASSKKRKESTAVRVIIIVRLTPWQQEAFIKNSVSHNTDARA